MITMMRKHHKVLMIVITALVCISFSWYWNKTDFAQMGNGVAGKLYDRNVSQVEYQRNARLFQLGNQLGMRDLVQALTLGAQSENEAYAAFSWNVMVLRHEADQLGHHVLAGLDPGDHRRVASPQPRGEARGARPGDDQPDRLEPLPGQ